MSSSVQYPNLVPCPVDYPTCSSSMTKVYELAPSDSNVSAFINLLADGTYHTIIAINAIRGPFRSEAKTPTLLSSLQQAQQSMLAILADWKKERFVIRS